jgi:hypothetical protein
MITTSTFKHEIVPGLIGIAVDSKKKTRAKSMWPKLCTQKMSKKAQEQDASRSGLGTLNPQDEGTPLTFDTQIAGPQQTWNHIPYSLAVRITKLAIMNNLYEFNGGGRGNLQPLFYDLGEAAEEHIETLMARFFNSADATTYHTTRWGSALASTAHNRKDGTTYSNKATQTDLTYTTFWTAIVAAENQYNDRQHRITQRINKLWIPPQLERKALEVIKSSDRPDTPNRAVSAYAQSGRNIEICKWPHMSDTDMWVLQKEGEAIRFYWAWKTQFAQDSDFQTDDTLVKVSQCWSAEIMDEQCFYFNIPA